MYAQKRNFTYIDELPELEDLESKGMPPNMHSGMGMGIPTQGQPHIAGRPLQFSEQDIPEKFRKFIRLPMGTPPTESGMAPSPNTHYSSTQEFFQPPSPPVESTPSRPTVDSPTCLEICSHIDSCPICSKFYKNDNAIYIIAIVVLSIICILLLKRVLNL